LAKKGNTLEVVKFRTSIFIWENIRNATLSNNLTLAFDILSDTRDKISLQFNVTGFEENQTNPDRFGSS
jgi:hypothetical protein